jgi:Fe2+ transport system protein FeoA
MTGVWQKTLLAGSGEMSMTPLSEFKEGERGVIARVNGRGRFRKRLQEMGFIKGAEVFVEKYAPLRDPMELVLKGYHVSLRVEEAAQIMMEKLENR